MSKQHTQYSGLSPQEVLESRQRHGSNTFSERKRKSRWRLFLGKLEDPIIEILIVAMTLSLLVACYQFFVTHEDATGVGFFKSLGVLLVHFLRQVVIKTFAYRFFQITPLEATTWLLLLLGTSWVLWGGELLRLLRPNRSIMHS